MSQASIGAMREAITSLDGAQAAAVARNSINEGTDPLEMINSGIQVALENMGEQFASGSIFLPELMLAAKAADAAVAVLEPELVRRGGSTQKLGKFLIATVKGDIHDIGKNIVSLMLKSSGFEVFDIGVDKSNEMILAAARAHQVDVIGLSALLTTTMPRIAEFLELLQESGLRDEYKVVVGGAPTSQSFVDVIGADGYAADAASAVELVKRMTGKPHK